MSLGSLYFPRGDYARAAEYFQQAVRVNPLDFGGRFYLGTCLMKLGKPRRRRNNSTQPAKRTPTNSGLPGGGSGFGSCG